MTNPSSRPVHSILVAMDEGTTGKLAANIFQDAAIYIRTYGWQVSGMSEHGKPRCSMGALASAYPVDHWDVELAELMYKTLYEELGGIGLTEFNYHHKDGEKVAQLFERVAAKLLQQPAFA
jgi:hypothetical protein